MTQRLPTPGGDNGDWGSVLNGFLQVAHNADGTLQSNVVGTTQIQANAVTNAQLDSVTQTSLAAATTAVQAVNGVSGTTVTLSASDVSAIPSAQLGVAGGVATLNSGTQLATAQLPTSVSADSYATYNVKAFGAKGDGSTNDSAAIAAAIAGLPSGGGIVYFPVGIYMVNQLFTIPSNVRLVGDGKNATIIKKSANVATALFNYSGTSTSVRCQRGGMQDMQLNGNGFTGPLVQALYADHLNFDRVWFYDNPDAAFIGEELWDSYLTHCEFEYCGTGASSTSIPAVQILGSPTNSSNVIGFTECRWESFYGEALYISSNGTTASAPYRIYLNECKMETAFVETSHFIDMTNDVSDIHIRGMYMAADSFNSGYTSSGAPDLINLIAANACTIKGMSVYVNNNTAHSIIKVYPGGGNYMIEDVFVNAVTSLGVGIVWFAGGNPTLRIRNVRYKGGTGGSVPVYASVSDTNALTTSSGVPTNTTLVDVPGMMASTQTASYTLALTDSNTTVEMNASTAVTVTVPLNTSVAFPIGTVIKILQYGAGQVTLVPSSGVTLRNPGTAATTKEQYSTITIRQRAVNEWVMDGSITGS